MFASFRVLCLSSSFGRGFFFSFHFHVPPLFRCHFGGFVLPPPSKSFFGRHFGGGMASLRGLAATAVGVAPTPTPTPTRSLEFSSFDRIGQHFVRIFHQNKQLLRVFVFVRVVGACHVSIRFFNALVGCCCRRKTQTHVWILLQVGPHSFNFIVDLRQHTFGSRGDGRVLGQDVACLAKGGKRFVEFLVGDASLCVAKYGGGGHRHCTCTVKSCQQSHREYKMLFLRWNMNFFSLGWLLMLMTIKSTKVPGAASL